MSHELHEALTFRVDDEGVGRLTFDDPGSDVNILRVPILEALEEAVSLMERRAADGRLALVLFRSGKEGNFIAGVDVHEIAGLETPEEAREKTRLGQRIYQRIADLPVPTVSAVRGTCLGGGTELALACDHRIVSDAPDTRIGLPEVKLGILPAFGGSTRLPRLCGIQNALQMILTGSPAGARKAGRIGLADRVVPNGRFEAGVETFREDIRAGDVPPAGYDKSLTEKLLEDNPVGRAILFSQARKRTRKRAGDHYPAPLRALRVIEEGYPRSVEESLELEVEAVAELAMTPESKNLIRVFLLTRGVKNALPEEIREKARPVEKVAVLGAGTMGGEIAEVVASNDVPVVLKDIEREPLDEALHHARSLFDKAVRKDVFDEAAAGRKFALITPAMDYDGFDDVDLVVEAVVERMDVKQAVLQEVEEAAPERCLFLTNTSSLSVDELASAASRPGQVGGLHFFYPAHKLPLVEAVRGEATSEEALATAFQFTLDIGKSPVVVDDAPGFLVNRLLSPYLNEAVRLVAEGHDVAAVDQALEDFGMPMGPCRLLDEIGLDVAGHARETMEEAFGERMSAPRIADDLADEGALGKKSGRGFYRYEEGEAAEVNPEFRERLQSRRGPDRETDPDEVRRRCLYLMVNEAAMALEEGIVREADHVDAAMIMGTGFPPFRGGLLRWADREGLSGIVDYLSRARDELGSRFAPADLLVERAADGHGFTAPAG
jgi:3-hydroxyacyl-CoA dehydrogenase/enoyl-CoA hydratase/3-hydroxybutyryl-CoA epimerase